MPELAKMSNYPGGFRTGVSVRGLPILNTYGGQVFWVDSGGPGGDSGNGTYHRPFATIMHAISRCVASNGDVIVCKAGHAETLTTVGEITFDVAGVTIMAAAGAVGALRPTITFASTDNAASVIVSADDVSIVGLLGVGGDDGLTAAFVVTGDGSFIDIEWQDASATVEAACAIQYNTANNVRCILKYAGFVTGNACLNAIQLIDCDNVEIDIDAYGEFSTGVVEMLTTASTNVVVRGYFYNDNVALSKNVVNTGGLACTWWTSGYDGKGGYSFSGGSAAGLAADDIATVATYASTASSQAASVGIQTSAAAANVLSLASQATSIGIGTSTTNANVISTSNSVTSAATSVGIGVSAAYANTVSVISQATSIGIGTSNANANAISAASTALSTTTAIQSTLTSVGLVISYIRSKVG